MRYRVAVVVGADSSGSAWHCRHSPIDHARVVEHATDLVRLVAVHAGRDLVRLLFPQLALDDLRVHLLDHRVAGRAGAGDVVLVDARARVLVRQDEVGRMAGGAHGGHRSDPAEQARAVDRQRVVLEDVILGDLSSLRYFRSLLVALTAQERDVDDRRRAPLIALR